MTPEYLITHQTGYILVEDPPNYSVVWSDLPSKIEAVSTACEEANCRKVLIRGTTVKMHLTTRELFELGNAIAKLRLQIAIVNTSGVLKEDKALLEEVAANDNSTLRFFDDEDSALDWLCV